MAPILAHAPGSTSACPVAPPFAAQQFDWSLRARFCRERVIASVARDRTSMSGVSFRGATGGIALRRATITNQAEAILPSSTGIAHFAFPKGPPRFRRTARTANLRSFSYPDGSAPHLGSTQFPPPAAGSRRPRPPSSPAHPRSLKSPQTSSAPAPWESPSPLPARPAFLPYVASSPGSRCTRPPPAIHTSVPLQPIRSHLRPFATPLRLSLPAAFCGLNERYAHPG